MWLIIVEAGLALALLVFIVWWTMFHKPAKGAGKAGAEGGEKVGPRVRGNDESKRGDDQ